MNALLIFWRFHIQKTVATLLGTMAVVDMTPYAEDFRELIPWTHWHAALRLLGAAAIFWRAIQAGQQS